MSKFKVLLIILLKIVASRSEAPDPTEEFRLFEGRTYSISSSVSIQEKQEDYIRHIREHYSYSQLRARIQFVDKDGKFLDYFHDSNSGILLTYDPELDSCSKGKIADLQNKIFGDNQGPISQLFSELDSITKLHLDHVLGPSKLIHYLESRFSELEVGKDNEDDVQRLSKLRNLPVSRRELVISLDENGTASLVVYYPAQHEPQPSDAAQLDHGPLVPLRIDVKFSASPLTTVIDFHNHVLHEELSGHIAGAHEFLSHGQGVLPDLFCFPSSLNCASLAKSTGSGFLKAADIFPAKGLRSAQLSFRSDAEVKGRQWRHFVAFDGLSQLMRIDAKQSPLLTVDQPASFTLIDFGAHRKVTMLTKEQQPSEDSTKGRSQSLELGSQQYKNRCLTTRLVSPGSSDPEIGNSLADLILGAEGFIYLGKSLVGDVSARVYEAQESKIPRWLAPRLAYRTPDGRWEERAADQEAGASLPLITVVYLNWHSLEPRLLRMDLFEQLGDHPEGGSSRRLKASVQFSSFQWNLGEAPNGDRVDGLFSLADKCDDQTGGRVTVNMILEWIKPPDWSEVKSHWIDDRTSRNSALSAALGTMLILMPGSLHDLESQLSHNRKTIEASFSVANLPKWVYEPTLIGRAELLKGAKKRVKVLKVSSIGDCFWQASLEDTDPFVYVYYDRLKNACFLDFSLKGDSADTSKSQLVRQNPIAIGELYLIERRIDDIWVESQQWLHHGNLKRLESWDLSLIPAASTSQKTGSYSVVQTRIRAAKLGVPNSLDRTAKIGSEQSPSSFPGLGYSVLESSWLLERRVSATSQPGCRLACLSEAECHSYSFCIRHPEAECLLSRLPLTRSVAAELASSSAAQRLTGENTFSLTNEAVIVRDFRCELHAKSFSDLFDQTRPTRLLVKAYDVAPVESPEQCAEICFHRTNDLLKKSNELYANTSSLASRLHMEGKADEIERLKSQHRVSFSNFCTQFMYLDSESAGTHLAGMMRRANSSAPSDFCVLSKTRDARPLGMASPADDHLMLQFETYSFQFEFLFERTAHMRLRGANLTEEESSGLADLMRRRPLSPGMLPERGEQRARNQRLLTEAAARDGANFQIERVGQAADCARLCIGQTSGLWPACRSFDIIARPHPLAHDHLDLVCVLNSQSLRISEHSRADLCEFAPQGGVSPTWWHYEPIVELAGARLQLDYALELPLDSEGPDPEEMPEGEHTVVSSAVVALLGVASGLLVGAVLAGGAIRRPIGQSLRSSVAGLWSSVGVESAAESDVRSLVLESAPGKRLAQ